MVDFEILQGLLLGYPECCIKQFVTEFIPPNERQNAFDGYLPCRYHAKLSKEFLVDHVLKRDLKNVPEPFQKIGRLRNYNEKNIVKVYKEFGQENFAKDCIEKAKEFEKLWLLDFS